MIKEFKGQYYFLSNFSSSIIKIKDLQFLSVEAAFQSFKDPNRQLMFQNLHASEAKRYGRQVRLRPDWEVIKDELMYKLVMEKFKQNPSLKGALLATGDEYLEEGNTWHDNYWGVCHCNKCSDKIGKII